MGLFDDEKSQEQKDCESAFAQGREDGRSGKVSTTEVGLREVFGTAVPGTKEYQSWLAGASQGLDERSATSSKDATSTTSSSSDYDGGDYVPSRHAPESSSPRETDFGLSITCALAALVIAFLIRPDNGALFQFPSRPEYTFPWIIEMGCWLISLALFIAGCFRK